MHNVNGVELTDAQFEEYNKLPGSQKAAYLEGKKKAKETSSQKSKDAGTDASIDKKASGNWWEGNKVDKNSRYTKVGGKWLSEEQLAHWQGLSDVRAQNDYLESIQGNVTDEEAERLNKKNPDTSEYENKTKGRGVGTITENTKPITKEEKKALEKADKAQKKEDKSFTKDTGVYVNNASGKVDEEDLPDILKVSAIDYKANDKYKVSDLFKAAKDVGWQPSQVEAKLNELYGEGKWSEAAMREWEKSGYANLKKNKETEVAKATGKEPEKEVEVEEETIKAGGTGSGAGGSGAGAGDGDGKEPEKEVEVEEEVKTEPKEEVKTEPKEEGSFLITSDKDMEALSEEEKLSAVNANIKNLRKEKEAHPEMAGELNEQLKNQIRMKEMVTNNLNLSREDVQGHVNDLGWAEESLNHNRTKGLITSWIDEHNDAKAKLKEAKASGDEKAIAAAQKELDDVPKEYGFFLLNALGTALKNMSVPGAFGRGQGNEKSMFQNKLESNLAAETNRWNKLKDEKVNAFTEDIKTKWGINSDQYKAANSILNDTNAKRAADRMGIFEDTDKLDAVLNVKSRLSNMSPSDRIKVIGMMESDPKKAVIEMMAASDLDMNEILNDAGNIVEDLVSIAGKGSSAVERFSSWLDEKLGGNK